MKNKVLIISTIMFLIISLLPISVLAANITSAQVTMTASKTEFIPGETVEYTVSVKNLDADRGIAGFGAVIEYDPNVLELDTTAQGCANWENASIGGSSKKFATTRNKDASGSAYSQNNEDIVKIKFTVKEVSSETTANVGLKSIELSNGALYRLSKIDANAITIKPKTVSEDPGTDSPTQPGDSEEPSNPTEGNKPSDSNSTGNTNNAGSTGTVNGGSNNNSGNSGSTSTNGSKTTKTGSTITRLPHSGISIYLAIPMGIAMMVMVIMLAKIKLVNKKIKKQFEDIENK